MYQDGKCLFPDYEFAKLLASGSAIIHKCIFAAPLAALGELTPDNKVRLANTATSFNLAAVLYSNLELFDQQFSATIHEIEQEFNALVTCDGCVTSVTNERDHTGYEAYTHYLANQLRESLAKINALSLSSIDGLQDEVNWMLHPAHAAQRQRILEGIHAVMEKSMINDISNNLN